MELSKKDTKRRWTDPVFQANAAALVPRLASWSRAPSVMHPDTEKHFTTLGIRYVRGLKLLVGDERITRFESAAHLRLPGEYRDFLKRYGNTAFEEFIEYPFIDKECPWANNGYGGMSVFYGLDAGPYDLEKQFANHVGRIPSDMLPIAVDGGGNLICLAFTGPDWGSVFFWDRDAEPEPGEQDLRTNVYLIARSFDDFLKSMRFMK
jgi:hypothetical protein